MPRSQTRVGDATGREKERLQRKHDGEIKSAATKTTLTSPPPVVERPDEVVDYSGGGTPNPGETAPSMSLSEALADSSTVGRMEDLPIDQVDMASLPDGTVDVAPDQEVVLDEPQPAGRFRSAAEPTVKEALQGQDGDATPVEVQEYRIMQVNTDLEDITIGKDNHFTFREGVRYKVTKQVYEHLDDKGYVRH